MPAVNPLWGGDRAEGWTFEKFGSLDTRAPRISIEDNNFSWIENFIPLGDRNLRSLYDIGSNLYSATGGLQIIFHYPFNIGSTQYIALFMNDGSAIQVNALTGASSTIAPAGTFYTAGNIPACAQWQSKYLLIVCTSQTNGYWAWDGTFLYGAGTLSPDITLTSPGQNYSSAPTVTVYGGEGSGATFTATVENGAVDQVTMTGGGSGYILTDSVQLAFSGGGSDNQAYGQCTLATTSGVSAVNVSTGGTGYSATSTVVFTGGSPSTKPTAAITQLVNGSIIAVTVYNPGYGYTAGSPPTVTFGDGSGATAYATLKFGQVSAVNITNGGTNYTGAPEVVFSAPTSLGVGNVTAQGTATVSSGIVTGVTITNPGLGYTSNPTVTFVGGNFSATATVNLFPYGLQGNTVETYQQRVWIGNVTKSYFSAATLISEFATSAGGGAFPATDSSLRAQITRYAQANGFLYGFGDSSVFVISNVQTSGTPPTTTFNNSNVDPQIGAAWRDTVCSFGRALVFANATGVYALYGGAAEKVSNSLDALFENANFTTTIPTAAVATIFETRVYCLNFNTVDYQGNTRNILAMWDGQRWFIASQSTQPISISTQEVSSDLTVWGTNGTSIFPLFKNPSTGLTKVFQSRLRYDPSYVYSKQINAYYGVIQNNDTANATASLTVDTEKGSITVYSGVTIAPGLNFLQTSTAAYGYSYGMTFTSTGKDVTVASNTLLYVSKYAVQG